MVMVMVIVIVEGRPRLQVSGEGRTGSAPMGSLQVSCFCYRGTFGVLPLTYFYLPKSARVYLFPQSVEIRYFRGGPVSVDPISPRPKVGGVRRPELALLRRQLLGQRARPRRHHLPGGPTELRADLHDRGVQGCQGYGLSVLRIRYLVPRMFCVCAVLSRLAILRIQGCRNSTL